uniref:GerAB/ArcD/ProY family transporter n=1 Tax=Agathobacter sp. TaxID=2021311 RepID=UPI0040576F67
MYVDNGKISDRQTFRLFVFDLLGIGTLLLPPYLAKLTGIDGVFAILLGGVCGYIYLRYLGFIIGKINTDAGSYLQQNAKKPIQWLFFGYVSLHSIFTAGFCAYVFGNLMQHALLKEESFGLILLLTMLLAAYAIGGGIESRARVYEVLFWFVFIPYVIMLLFSIRDVKIEYLDSFFDVQTRPFLEGSYLVFLLLTPLFFSIFLLEKRNAAKGAYGSSIIKIVTKSLLFSVVVFLGSYVILVGCFGEKGLASMRYPIITLMSTVQFKGSFLKRMDALMLGVWFFTLFALINLHLHYGVEMMKKIKGSAHMWQIAIATSLVYIVAYAMENSENFLRLFLGYYSYVAVPVMLAGPALLLLIRKKKKPKVN